MNILRAARELDLADVVTFGKYLGETVRDMIDDNPDYFLWATSNVEWFKCNTSTWEYWYEVISHDGEFEGDCDNYNEGWYADDGYF